jgi:predicted NACHT family NTPase
MERTSTHINFQVAKKEYCEQLANLLNDVKLAGIAVAGQKVEKSQKTTHIFVIPDVVEEVKTSLRRVYLKPDIFWKEEDGNIFIAKVKTSNRQATLIREEPQEVQWENSCVRNFSAQKLLTEITSDKLVLLGAPGSGKTTLMNYLAVMIAQQKPQELGLPANTDLLPIIIRIRNLSRFTDISVLEYVYQFADKNLSVKPLPPGFFEYWLEDGQALVLLDGLDEVADAGKRYEVVNKIESFLGRFSQNRAIITSRPAGYRRDFFRTEDFPHYQLQLFDDAKIDEFINRWYDSRVLDSAEAQRRKGSLRKALYDNERIKMLARSPLLLTIIALIHRYQAFLPKERYKLYDKAVETLLTSWDTNKEFSNHLIFKYLWLDDLRRLLESLAYWIHSTGSAEDKEGGTLIYYDELINKLSEYIKTLKQIELYEAQKEAKTFVDFIRDRTGLLNEQGQDCYAFVHKTFQEYLCTQEIIYQGYNENDFGIVLQHIRDYLHDPHWREVLLLLIAQQTPKQAVKAIREILNHGSDYEKWLHRDLLFAGSCLAENPKDLKVADTQLPQEILNALIQLEVDDSPRVSNKIRSRVFQILCSLNETAFETQALQLLKDRAKYINKVRLQEYRAALGEKEEVIATLLALLEDEDSDVRYRAAAALGNLGNGSQAVVQRLLVLLKKDKDYRVRYRTAQALGNLGNDSQAVVQQLLALLKDEYYVVRDSAAEALGNLGNGSEAVVQGLLTLLKDEDSDVRYSAAEALGNLGNGSEAVVQGLLALLKDKDYIVVRDSAVQALGELGNGSPPVVQQLLALLEDEDSDVRYRAAEALGNLGNSSPAVVQRLLALLKDKDSWVCYNAAQALSKLSNGSPAVVQRLLALLEDKDYIVRDSAAQALGKLGNGSPAVVQRLLALLEDEDYIVRDSAAQALGNLGNGSPPVVQKLLALLKDKDSSVCYSAARALVNLGNTSEVVLQRLLALLEDKDYIVRNSAAQALGKLGKKTPIVVTALVQWIEKHQNSKYVGNAIDVLWDLVALE